MKLLIVDDEPIARRLTQHAVDVLGHHSLVAADGDQAWELIEREQPDVVITDWKMPGMDGLQLCRAVRARAADRYTYLILVTALTEHQQVLTGLQAGADDYLVKPLDPFQLQARLLVAARVTALHAQLHQARAELAKLADTDALTGLSNRRRFDTDLTALREHSARYRRPFALALCDIDHFKRYNDTAGHPAGDRALRDLATTLADALRGSDAVYRYGGEEFVLLLPEQHVAQGLAAVDRLRRKIDRAGIGSAGGSRGLTISGGVTAFDPDEPREPAALILDADRALYCAKAHGRNIVLGPGSAPRRH